MINEIALSFRDNFREKVKNPFLATYIIVWTIRNWELIYTVFNFDNDLKLNQKLSLIKCYFDNHPFLISLLTNICWTFLVIVITYGLLNLSRAIVNLYEKRLTPWIYSKTDSKSIVLMEDFLRVKEIRDNLQKQLSNERDEKIKLETKLKEIQSELDELKGSKSGIKTNINEDKDDISILIQKIKKDSLVDTFADLVLKINQNSAIAEGDTGIGTFLKLGLISFKGSSPSRGYKYYKLTEDGESVMKRIRLE